MNDYEQHRPFPVTCAMCGQMFSRMVTHSHLKAAHDMTTKQYAEQGHVLVHPEWTETKGLSMRGAMHPNWKGGRSVNGGGYVTLFIDGHNVYEHRVVMERHLGRSLRPNEHIHHKDKNTTNNAIDNLEVVTHSGHTYLHALERWTDGGVLRSKYPGPKEVEQSCRNCARTFVKRTKEIRFAAKNGQQHFFCSQTCANRYHANKRTS